MWTQNNYRVLHKWPLPLDVSLWNIYWGLGVEMLFMLWCLQLRRLWSEERPIPHVQLEADPDLNSCLLHQQLQVINCCIARKHRRVLALESLDSVLKETSEGSDTSHNLPVTDHKFYARTYSGDYVLRLGADYPSENLTMLETGEPIYHPVMQVCCNL